MGSKAKHPSTHLLKKNVIVHVLGSSPQDHKISLQLLTFPYPQFSSSFPSNHPIPHHPYPSFPLPLQLLFNQYTFIGVQYNLQSILPFIIQKYLQMITRNQNKTALKTICHIRQSTRPQDYISPQLDQEEVVTFQTHSQKMDLNKQQENDLFQKVLKFLKEFITNKKLWIQLQERMNKYAKSSQGLSSEKKNEKMLSFKKMTFGSKICFDAEVVQKDHKGTTQFQYRAIRGNNKKISILINEQDFSSSSSEQMFSDQLISQNLVRTIRSIQIPHLQLNLETIELIYDTPQPFLITLSLCIFTRYCINTRRKVKFEESAWVLCVATVIAYKLYYDEEIQGLIDCFTNIMKVERQDLIDLQRCFLEEIDYATVIRNYDYHFVMSKLLSMPVQQTIVEEL